MDVKDFLIGEAVQRSVGKVIEDRSAMPLLKLLGKIVLAVLVLALVLLLALCAALPGILT